MILGIPQVCTDPNLEIETITARATATLTPFFRFCADCLCLYKDPSDDSHLSMADCFKQSATTTDCVTACALAAAPWKMQ